MIACNVIGLLILLMYGYDTAECRSRPGNVPTPEYKTKDETSEEYNNKLKGSSGPEIEATYSGHKKINAHDESKLLPTINRTDRFLLATTTAPTPAQKSRKCHVCRGSPQICEQLYVLEECPADKQFCINELTNKEDASRTVNRRCGTQDECDSGWYQTYADDDKCTNFDEKLVYTSDFYCEYCCNEDGCNKLVNPPNTWTP
ncbi:uncharacterized protein LOC127865668 isoform X1 [Dreissena polymorpha]|uniref:Secreted protein n=1 Tax=Dreissena polymorpha TaxID=45954 RepID=A0A9D4LLZ7_DREPO|nr:uncharacterized protein LOC127865668 isoform X1 [Dreissena polymorpha]KAH3860391.1 hypothetical protein DPMN_023290 [Dreissena polymorpha]